MSSDLEAWIGRQHTTDDVVSLRQARALAATLDRDPSAIVEGQPLPAGWHWIYFNGFAPRSELARDGHAERGGFLPPVPHPHRMWAGGKLTFSAPLLIGEPARRTSTLESIREKTGKAGPLVFVTIRHEISNDRGVAIDEQMTLVYLTRADEAASAATPPSTPEADADWSETFVADEATLFRFSALTLNSHRIHYDHPYTTGVEGYPGLVVHGPLIALLLLDAGSRHANAGETPQRFDYRARKPLFCNEEFFIRGRSAEEMTIEATHPERGVASKGLLELG